MTPQETREQTRKFLQHYVSVDDIDEDQDLFAAGLVNSLFAMQLVLFIEKTFAVKVTNEDLDIDNFRSLQAIVGFIGRKTAGA